MNVVAINWEGRGYDKSSWEADRQVVLDTLGSGPIWAGHFDVFILFADKDFSVVEGGVTLTTSRHGETDIEEVDNLVDAFAWEEISNEDIDWIEDELSHTERFDSFEAWEEWAYKEEILPEEFRA